MTAAQQVYVKPREILGADGKPTGEYLKIRDEYSGAVIPPEGAWVKRTRLVERRLRAQGPTPKDAVADLIESEPPPEPEPAAEPEPAGDLVITDSVLESEPPPEPEPAAEPEPAGDLVITDSVLESEPTEGIAIERPRRRAKASTESEG
jgi:hypothetical protein